MRPFTVFCRPRRVGACLASLWIFSPLFVVAQQQSLLRTLEAELLEIVEKAKPSVVTVVGRFSTDVEARSTSDRLLGIFSDRPPSRQMTFMNVASGLIIDSSGHIITKSSVVEGADSIGVQLSDGRTFPASLIGSDPESGLSVIRVSGVELVPASLATEPRIRVGAWVTIIGNSLGVSPSVSLGVVNGLRSDGTIQLSGHVIPGNNGSPIFDSNGQVIGVVAGWVSLLDGVTTSDPIPYVTEGTIAYPISTVLAIKEHILSGDIQRRAWLGIEVRASTEGTGALVTEVEPGSPAEQAGLRVGDRIVACNDRPLKDLRELKSNVLSAHPGDRLHLSVIREEELLDVQIVLGKRTNSAARPAWVVQSGGMDMQGNVYVGGRSYSPGNAQLLERRIRYLEKELETLRAMLKKRP